MKWVGFDRMLKNALRRIVQRGGGEFHGSFWELAEALQLEVGGITDDEDVILMKRHVMQMGPEALAADTGLVFFRDYKTGEVNYVLEDLVYDC